MQSPNTGFRELLEAQWAQRNYICLELNTSLEDIPQCVQGENWYDRAINFNREIVTALNPLVGAFVFDADHYARMGENTKEEYEGITVLRETISRIRETAPYDVPVIIDIRENGVRAEQVSETAASIYDDLGADAATITPLFPVADRDVFAPYLERTEKGIIILPMKFSCADIRSGEMRDLCFSSERPIEAISFLHRLFDEENWNQGNNLGLFWGITFPDELREVRGIVGIDTPIFISAVAPLGDNGQELIAAGRGECGKCLMLCYSRSILHASNGTDFQEAAYSKAIELRAFLRMD